MDTAKKSLYKTISWRIIAFLISYLITYLFTTSSEISLIIVIVANTLSMVAYFIHERIWNNYET